MNAALPGTSSSAAMGMIVGRDAELGHLSEAVTAAAPSLGPSGLLIVGEPGLGKTTLWTAAVANARNAGATVLLARPGESDGRRSFSGLADLLRPVPSEAVDGLPGPQRHALEVALLRAEPTATTDERAIAPAILGVLQSLTSQGLTIVAVDDAQWLDGSSADALAFAVRRFTGSGLRLLLARRTGTPSELERQLGGVSIERLDLPPLSMGAIRHLLLDRLGLELSRRRLRELYLRTGGNPLFALELAPHAGAGPAWDIASAPQALDEAVDARLRSLPQPLREVLLAVSLAPAGDSFEISAAFGDEVLAEAIESGLVADDGRVLRAAHPVMASVALGRATAATRRRLHAALAVVASDPERRLRHEAGATARPDVPLAGALEMFGDRAAARGAVEDAADLAGEAVRLTPLDDVRRDHRALVLAERLLLAGDHAGASEILSERLASMAAGPDRARVRLLLVEARFHLDRIHLPEMVALFDQALADAPTNPAVHAMVLARRSHHRAVGLVEDIRVAEAEARRGLALATGTSPEVAAEAAHALAWALHLRGRSAPDLTDAVAPTVGRSDMLRGLGRLRAERLLAQGHIGQARAALERLLALADERGEVQAYVAIRLQLTELELRAGRWGRATALLDEWIESPERGLISESGYERCRALLAGGIGDAAEAERWASVALRHSEERGLGWDRLEALRGAGLAALVADRPLVAAEALGTVWAHTRRAGVADPGIFPVAPDFVEALVATGRRAEAHRVARSLVRFGARCEHPWAAASGQRSLAHVDLAMGDLSATKRAWSAAATLDALGLPFDAARTLLAAGRKLRRSRRWGDARSALAAAKASFETIGSSGWADACASELERIGGRGPSPIGRLTASEARVAGMAAEGLSNKEIAQALAISVDTVERHLSRSYAKLGVQSRSQLTRHLATSRD